MAAGSYRTVEAITFGHFLSPTRELEIAPKLDHKHIVQTFKTFSETGFTFMVMQLATRGDILKYVRVTGSLKNDTCKVYFAQICSALEYLHNHRIAHRDVKCENLLLDGRSNILLADFGFARRFTSTTRSQTFCGSAAYAAPEVLQSIPYDVTKNDVWSAGVILYILKFGVMPYDDTNKTKLIRMQRDGVTFPKNVDASYAVKDLLQRILNHDIDRRATLDTIKLDHWMAGSSWAEQGCVRSFVSSGV